MRKNAYIFVILIRIFGINYVWKDNNIKIAKMQLYSIKFEVFFFTLFKLLMFFSFYKTIEFFINKNISFLRKTIRNFVVVEYTHHRLKLITFSK